MPQPSSATEEQSISTGRFKPLVSLLKHKWLAFIIIIVVSTMGVWVALKVGKPVYQATAVVLVSPKFTPNLVMEKNMDLNRTEYELYIKQQISMITHNDVLQKALQVPELRENWFLPGETDKSGRKRLKKALSIKYKRKTPFLTITLTNNSPKRLDIVLNAVIEIYLQQSKAEIFYDSSGRIERLQQHRKELEQFIFNLQKRRIEIGEELGVTTFQENSLNPYDKILIESTSAFTQARRKRVEAETYLSALMTKQTNGKTPLEILVNELVINDSLLKSYKMKLLGRRTELQTKILGLTAKHPSRRRAEQEIAKIDLDITTATSQLMADSHNRLLEKYRSEIYQAHRLEQALQNELDRQRTQANHYTILYNQALVLNKDILRAYNQLEKINDRIDFLTIESNAPGFARLDTAAKMLPPSGTRNKVLFLFLVAAVGLAVAIPILLDLLDRRIQTPGEVHKILGFPPLAWILERHDNSTTQLATDNLRRMALALERDWHTHETSCFVLTSVKPGGGTTTFTLELAHLLSELGIRTLAMELNAFKPDSRYREGATGSLGMTTLLSPTFDDSVPVEMMIIAATMDLPERLPIGEPPKHHLATYGKLRPLLKQLNTHYDLILIDTPPLLLSADVELLGEMAGGVLLVIEALAVSPGELKRAASILERLNPPVVGAVLNRVKVFRGGGYFAELLKEYETKAKLQPKWIQRLFWH